MQPAGATPIAEWPARERAVPAVLAMGFRLLGGAVQPVQQAHLRRLAIMSHEVFLAAAGGSYGSSKASRINSQRSWPPSRQTPTTSKRALRS